ncbi:MAG: hypothetical protein CBC48_04265 [bacterium TMED88]|nr:hypothetical protein [Deltaproteobacteria bacterium]OUV35276.1 MAG: hypothetical protein CBC48_04265 [bacterium TMED88]
MSSAYRNSFSRGLASTRKYLAKHAESESLKGPEFARKLGHFGQALVIPAWAEGEALSDCLAAVPSGAQGHTLIVTVINATRDAPGGVRASNRESFLAIESTFGRGQRLGPQARLHEHPVGSLIVLDRSEAIPLPPKQGVGLARKIGCDFLLSLMESGAIESPWIHCSDADTKLPATYFEQAQSQAQDGETALIYPFRHRPESGGVESYAIALEYEISLRYYVLGLRFAGSDHAFHSMGSALALHGNAYAQVRGFPRREAAEDFYCLNKLGKLGKIKQLKGCPVEPSSRGSNRVPFGTGAAIRRQLEVGPNRRQTYDPRIFAYLKVWQQTLKAVRGSLADRRDIRSTLARAAGAEDGVDAKPLFEALELSGSFERAEHCFRGSPGTVNQRIRDNFDAFRTLKLIHALRDSGLGRVSIREAMADARFIAMGEEAFSLSISSLADRMEHLDYGAQ